MGNNPNTVIEKNYTFFLPNLEILLKGGTSNYNQLESEVNDNIGLDPSRYKRIRARYVHLQYKEEKLSIIGKNEGHAKCIETFY